MSKEFFIRCYVRDALNGHSDTGLLKFIEGFIEAGWSFIKFKKKSKIKIVSFKYKH